MNPPPPSVTPHEFVPSFLKIAKDLITGSVLSILFVLSIFFVLSMLCFALLPEKESFQIKRLHLSLNLSFST